MKWPALSLIASAMVLSHGVLNAQDLQPQGLAESLAQGFAMPNCAITHSAASEISMLERMRNEQASKQTIANNCAAEPPADVPITLSLDAPPQAPLSQSSEPSAPTKMTVTDRPDVFGSTALPVSHTPLDAKWQNATHARLSKRTGPWAKFIRKVTAEDRAEQLRSVNMWVNARVHFTQDPMDKNQADRWAGANETLRRNQGDCEDYAIAKMKLLEAAGVSRADMYLVIANDLVRHADHAILVVRLDTELMVLDSSTDQVIDARYVADYRPIISYGQAGAWVHGYAEIPPVQIANTTEIVHG